MIIQLSPIGSMSLLSQLEVDSLKASSRSNLYQLFRNCCLAVLNSGSQTDSSKEILEKYKTFEVNVLRRERGVKLELVNPPDEAFVDGKLIRGIHENLFSVLRDILYVSSHLEMLHDFNLTQASHITNLVFAILRNAGALKPSPDPNMIVCWGGHSISDVEYNYCHEVGYQLGLRELNIVTGCGPGAMEGPMKGATIGHAKQRVCGARYMGLTEPSIIAAEPPNPIVNELIILPDIEKRLEAFVRMAHGIIVFPGGVGTAEEILYLLGILMHPENRKQTLPVIFTGPKESASYFAKLDEFIRATLGPEAANHYQIIIDDADLVARHLKGAMPEVLAYRRAEGDAFYFNWSLKIEPELQLPFEPSHENISELHLHGNQSKVALAANLRRVFSGIVAGNVKEQGIRAVEKHGPFIIDGDAQIMADMDRLLKDFVAQGRMKLPGAAYHPCYKIARS
ncbi:nucleotide 5'-monophosphate nucleosidase PpnN [Gallaecimonas xiamenensis]|uniref:Pyrimidine/purine nucleotide 5'-monophosphate nucleosidase n=1 Tax=Gallaecimonas xiamenensis 3-C-1 TaxID=745411 RepID=K2K9Q9_9GAMM|nr:nucleotide 5'-monophosphate nucleosidase PpnN [Gallaecimonas xiamenensis]EKE74045.1 lysine decarboxylase family protein [Gallaecimonas xiamenensis 3-C-1]